MSRNFFADIETQREYLNITYFNQSGTNQIAKYETTLLKPLFHDPNKWQLAVNRFRIPLSGIPLTSNNIPFNQWQIGFTYQTQAGTPLNDVFKYVPQYNQKTVNNTNQMNMFVFDNTQTSCPVKTATSNNGFTNPIEEFQTSNGVIEGETVDYAILNTNEFLYTLTDNGNIRIYTSDGQVILHYIAPANTYYYNICSNKQTGDFYVGQLDSSNNSVIQAFIYNGSGNWTATSTYYNVPGTSTAISQSGGITFVGTQLFYCDVAPMTAPSGTDLQVLVWDTVPSNVNPAATYNLAIISSAVSAFPEIVSDGTYLYVYYSGLSNAVFVKYNTTFTEQARLQISNALLSNNINTLIGFDQNNNLLYSTQQTGQGLIKYIAGVSTTTMTQSYIGVDPNSDGNDFCTTLIYPKPLVSSIVDAGPYDIFTYQSYLNKINQAFNEGFLAIKAQVGSAFLPTEPPRVIYDSTTKFFSIIVEGSYLTLNPDGSNQYILYMNTALWSKFFFPFTTDSPTAGFYKLLMQNNGINAIQGTGSATLPQFIYIQQENSTIYQFFDLTRIIIGTSTIPVSGDAECKSFSTNGIATNNSLNMITDILPDTSNLTNSDPLIYVPAGILRWYNLYAQQPFTKLDIITYYETKDGIIKPVNLPNGEYFSIKLEFKKGQGDF